MHFAAGGGLVSGPILAEVHSRYLRYIRGTFPTGRHPLLPAYTALYPFLCAASFVLYVAVRNPGEFALGDLGVVLAATLAVVAAIFAVATLVCRDRAEGRLPALVTFAVVAWVLGASTIKEWITSGPVRLPPFLLASMGGTASVLLIYGLARHPFALRTAATFLTGSYTLLVLAGSVGLISDLRGAPAQVTRSALASELAHPIRSAGPAPGPLRDVYVIVLDEYASGGVLRELGFDNRPFEDSLRVLGFHVPASMTSNYAHTTLSLSSFLNASHVNRAQKELPRGSTDPTLLNHLVARSRVARFFRDRGYRHVFYPSSWWNATRSSPTADSVVQVETGRSLGRELSRTELRRVVWGNTLFARYYWEAEGDGEIVRGTLEGVARLPSVQEPVFAFAHILSPHPPYVFDRSCGAQRDVWQREPASYLAQIECLNGMLLAMVTRLIRDSDIAPVIVLQGDHGSAFRQYANVGDLSLVSPAAARERLGAFGAYYLPEGGAVGLGDTLTVVNVLGHVLRRYFGAELPPEPDAHYLSLQRAPFEFRLVEPAWFSPH